MLGEIRPYLVGTGGGELILDSIDGPIVKVKITGPAANVMTVRWVGGSSWVVAPRVCHAYVCMCTAVVCVGAVASS